MAAAAKEELPLWENLLLPLRMTAQKKYMNGQPEKNISMVFLKMSSNFEG